MSTRGPSIKSVLKCRIRGEDRILKQAQEVWSAGSGTAYRLRKAFRRPGKRLWDHGSLVGEIYEVVAKLKVGQG